jgi:hypothetical protein
MAFLLSPVPLPLLLLLLLVSILCCLPACRSAGSLLAFKALIAADTLGSSIDHASPNTTGKAMASGSYTMYWDKYEGIGASTTAVTAPDIMSCLRACDMAGSCAAAGMLVQDLAGLDTLMAKVAECRLIMGDSTQAIFLRSVTKVDMDRLVSLPPHPAGMYNSSCKLQHFGCCTPTFSIISDEAPDMLLRRCR